MASGSGSWMFFVHISFSDHFLNTKEQSVPITKRVEAHLPTCDCSQQQISTAMNKIMISCFSTIMPFSSQLSSRFSMSLRATLVRNQREEKRQPVRVMEVSSTFTLKGTRAPPVAHRPQRTTWLALCQVVECFFFTPLTVEPAQVFQMNQITTHDGMWRLFRPSKSVLYLILFGPIWPHPVVIVVGEALYTSWLWTMTSQFLGLSYLGNFSLVTTHN